MNTLKRAALGLQIVRPLLVLLLACVSVSHAQTPSQMPLLPKSGTGAAPNIMLTMDDSGSMNFRHMPEQVFSSDTFATTNPVQSNTVRWNLTDGYQVGTNFQGTVPGILSSANYVLRALRSSDTNSMFYNPHNRYLPWLTDDGVTRNIASPITAAMLNPPLKDKTATSISTVTIGVGSKTFTAQTGKTFTNGQDIVIYSSASPLTNWMVGTIGSYNSGSGNLVVNVGLVAGSGATLSSWNIVQTPVIDLTKVVPVGTFVAGNFVVGSTYTIMSKGTTDFTLIGAANNTPGTVFVATGVGVGTGLATAGPKKTNTFTAGNFVVGQTYTIVTTGSTNFVAIGAANNLPGTVFVATGVGSGSGTAKGLVVGKFTAGNFVVGNVYTISTPGTTNFTTIGAPNNSVGTTFLATGAGSGTGTASGAPAGIFNAGSFVVGATYTIVFPGTTNFTSIGAANNSIGTTFTATGTGSGTGTASGAPFDVFTADKLQAGVVYTILSTGGGSTNFMALGAPNNNVGTNFVAWNTGLGTGTGTAAVVSFAVADGQGWCFALPGNITGTDNAMTHGCQVPNGAFVDDPGAYFSLGSSSSAVAATALVAGNTYTITFAGTTDFTAVGAADNNVGTTFVATSAGAGTGTVSFAYYQAVNVAANYTPITVNAAPITTYTKYGSRTDCASSVCTRDEERQNFANWFTYYRTRNLMARGSMMEAFGPEPNTFRLGFGRINKGAGTVDGISTKVIESDSATYPGGGGVRAFDATRRSSLFKWLENMPASGSTPLPDALDADGKYFSRADAQGPYTDDPSVNSNNPVNNLTCRRSYTILTTDGYWNSNSTTYGNVDDTLGPNIVGASGQTYQFQVGTKPYTDGTSNTLADVAMYYWNHDLQPGMANAVPPVGDNTSFWQNMTNYTVGLGVRGSLNPSTDLPALAAGTKSWPAAGSGQTAYNIDDLWHAAVNSRGKYFSAKDPIALANAVKAILGATTGQVNATAGLATASITLQSQNFKYVPTYMPTYWTGNVTSYGVDAQGQVGAAVWDAAAKMPTWSARNVVTWDSGIATPAAVPFAWGSLSSANQAALGPVAAANTTDFVNFLLGDHSKEGVAQPFRERIDSSGNPFILGDFVNGNPVFIKGDFVGPYTGLGLGAGTPSDPTYAGFVAMKSARTGALFAGSGDGMLHAFKDTTTGASTDGQEVFAYVPRAVYSNLYKLTDKTYGNPGPLVHQYFVDGPLVEGDAYVKAPGQPAPSWRNYLLGTLGAGGRAVFALDVTSTPSLGPTNVRWEMSDPDMGYILAPVIIGVLPNGKWVAIFGNGYSSTLGKATLFVVDIETGAIIQKLDADISGGNGLGGVTPMHDANGQITALYGGDLKGHLWKFVYSGGTFTLSSPALFTATDGGGVAQPITANPALFINTNGGVQVLFGTGKLLVDTDATDTSTQTVYSVWDKPSESLGLPLTRSNLQARSLTAVSGTGAALGTTFYSFTSSTPVDYAGAQRGWYFDVSGAGGVMPGGRVAYPVQAVAGQIGLVTAVAPVQGTPAPCDSASGTAIDFVLPSQDGTNPANHVYDTNGDGMANAADAGTIGLRLTADGNDVVVRTSGTATPFGGGGGGSGGDCTQGTCSSNYCPGSNVPTSPLCPEANTYLDSVQTALKGYPICIGCSAPLQGPSNNYTPDRVWRRILNPPIH